MSGPTLTAPFARTEQKGEFTYVPWEEITDRLNVVLGICGWGFTCEVVERIDKEVIVKGRLILGGVPFEQFAGHVHQSGDWGDTFKAAASKALVKCASMPGVGLYLSLQRSPKGTTFAPGFQTSSNTAGNVVEEGESVPPKPSAPSSTPRAKGRKPSDRGETTSAPVEPGDASAASGEAPADAEPGKPYLAGPKLEEAREALKR